MPYTRTHASRKGSLLLVTCLLAACRAGGGSFPPSGNTVSNSPSTSLTSSSANSSSASRSSVDATIFAPTDVFVPPLAYDDTTISLVWKKPKNYAIIMDYNVYQNGTKLGSAKTNNTANSAAKPYIDAFYAADTANFHTKITFHNYTVTGLSPNTDYSFTVRSVDANGVESADSVAVVQKTAPTFTNIIDITSVGAMTTNIAAVNTPLIQSAIDTCSAGSTSAYGCKVRVPAGTFNTGALFLKSNMTLELVSGATLKGSALSSDYPLDKGYQIYDFATNSTDDRRPPSLLNALSSNHMNSSKLGQRQGYDDTRGAFSNIRIVGAGTLDGNGWASTGTISDEARKKLPQYFKGKSSTLSSLLAKDQVNAGVAELPSGLLADIYSNRRSSLTTFRGVNGIYFAGLTLRNPAFHGVMFLESQNIVFANNSAQTYNVNNGDGVEFGNSDGIIVFNNLFDCGDDNINFASGQGTSYADASTQRPQQNAWIFNNYMRKGHGGVVAGSHTGAWVQDILAEDNVMYKTEVGLRMKSTPATGGGARRIIFRDSAMKDIAKNAFVFTLSYTAGSNTFTKAAASAQFRDITIQNVTIDGTGKEAIAVDGYNGNDSTLGYAATFQEYLTFDTLKFTNATATSIDRLKNSNFKNITITNSGSNFWKLSNSINNSFSKVTQKPDGTY